MHDLRLKLGRNQANPLQLLSQITLKHPQDVTSEKKVDIKQTFVDSRFRTVQPRGTEYT